MDDRKSIGTITFYEGDVKVSGFSFAHRDGESGFDGPIFYIPKQITANDLVRLLGEYLIKTSEVEPETFIDLSKNTKSLALNEEMEEE